MAPKSIPFNYDINRMDAVDLVTIIHIDDYDTRFLELKLSNQGQPLNVDDCTVTARFVTARDKLLLSDDVICTASGSTITIPIDAAAVQSTACDIKIEVNIVSGEKVLTLPFPLWIRVRGSILDDAEVTPESEGTIRELLDEAKAELERVQGYVDEEQVLDILDNTLGAIPTARPTLLLDNNHPSGDYFLYSIDSKNVRHNIGHLDVMQHASTDDNSIDNCDNIKVMYDGVLHPAGLGQEYAGHYKVVCVGTSPQNKAQFAISDSGRRIFRRSVSASFVGTEWADVNDVAIEEIKALIPDVSGKEDKVNKAESVDLAADITAEDSVRYTSVKVLKNTFRIIRDNLLSGKADKSEIPTKTSDLTNDSFMPMETVTSINDCTEGDVIYQVSTRDSLFYIFNVLKGVYWTQFKLDLDGIHVRFNEKSGVTGEWQGFDEFRALEDTAMKVSVINSSNQSSEDFYTSVKAVVNYIAAQGFATQQDISDKVDKVTIPRNTLIAGDGDGGIKASPYFVTDYKEDIASGIPAGLPNCEAVHASLEDAKTEVTLALDNVNNAVINIENNILPQKADKSEIPTKTSQLANDSNFLTQHQDISGKVDKIYVPNNWLLAADGAGGMKNSQYQVTTYSSDIEDSLPIAVPNCAAVKSSITAAIAQVVNNTLPVETVSSIDSCTENGVLYIVETRDNYYYVLNNIKNAVWLQIKIDSYGISQRWNDKDGTTGEWQGFNSFGYLEDSSLKATAINSSNQGSDDNYPSVKAVVNYVNNHSGVTIQSAVVNQNGTITFTMSNGSPITTTGASVIGPAGDDYILTAQDKTDIANIVLQLLPTTEGVQYGN
jgi:hypothetical protein